MRNGCLTAVALLVVVVVGSIFWFNRTGTFSRANFDRIHRGMSVVEVNRLLGRPGVEILESELPGIVDWSVPADHPKRVKAVVTGERYLRWEHGDSYVLVSFRGGVVAEKWFYAPSL